MEKIGPYKTKTQLVRRRFSAIRLTRSRGRADGKIGSYKITIAFFAPVASGPRKKLGPYKINLRIEQPMEKSAPTKSPSPFSRWSRAGR